MSEGVISMSSEGPGYKGNKIIHYDTTDCRYMAAWRRRMWPEDRVGFRVGGAITIFFTAGKEKLLINCIKNSIKY